VPTSSTIRVIAILHRALSQNTVILESEFDLPLDRKTCRSVMHKTEVHRVQLGRTRVQCSFSEGRVHEMRFGREGFGLGAWRCHHYEWPLGRLRGIIGFETLRANVTTHWGFRLLEIDLFRPNWFTIVALSLYLFMENFNAQESTTPMTHARWSDLFNVYNNHIPLGVYTAVTWYKC
jgi:hypothetical protein